jgi:hypothetical protein
MLIAVLLFDVIVGELRVLVGRQVLVFVMIGDSRHERGGGFHVIGRGPSQPLLGRETAAISPALLGRNATAAVALAGKRGRIAGGGRHRPGNAEGGHHVRQGADWR